MIIKTDTHLQELLFEYPQCIEFLWSFAQAIDEHTTVESLAKQSNYPTEPFILGLERVVKRVNQNPCDFSTFKDKIIKPKAVNIAGFVSFTWQNAFIEELQSFARQSGISLNLNIFPKHKKKEFQNYMSVCKSADDLPEILIGKGYSSLSTSQFIDTFVKSGIYCKELDLPRNSSWEKMGLYDIGNNYHPYGLEEELMVYDETIGCKAGIPSSWDDILKPEYKGAITQMGKSIRDHFGFVTMFYLFNQYGEDGIRKYASNVNTKQHFTETVKNIALNAPEASAINTMHGFASLFIRSDAREKITIVNPSDGNPVTPYFFLVKNSANADAEKMAKHLCSKNIGEILLKAGTAPALENLHPDIKNNKKWIGWDTIKNARLPFLKEYLSGIAYEHYTDKEPIHKNKSKKIELWK